MLRARQQQPHSASTVIIQLQSCATPQHRQGVQGSAQLGKAEQEHGRRPGGWGFALDTDFFNRRF